MSVFKRFLRDESGATAIEYGLIAAGISVAIIATVNTPRRPAQEHLLERVEPARQRRQVSGLASV